MKISYRLLLAVFGAVCFVGSLFGKVIPNFEPPQDVVLATTSTNNLPQGDSNLNLTYDDLKGAIANTKYGFALSILNFSGQDCVLVVNGKLVQARKDGKDLGALVISNRGETPVPFNWFKRYGDTMIIGIFQIDTMTNHLSGGQVFAVRIGDLLGKDGVLRELRIGIDRPYPIAGLAANHFSKPSMDPRASPPIAMKAPMPNLGPVVQMKPFLVQETTGWGKFSAMKDKKTGKVIGTKVDSVKEGTPYAEAGLKAGMVITAVKIDKDPDDVDAVSAATESTWTQGNVYLKVSTPPDATTQVVTITSAKLRKALPVRKDKTLASTSP